METTIKEALQKRRERFRIPSQNYLNALKELPVDLHLQFINIQRELMNISKKTERQTVCYDQYD